MRLVLSLALHVDTYAYTQAYNMCISQAAKRNLAYPNYAWITFEWFPDKWWTEKVAGESLEGCTDEMLEKFLIQSRPLLIHTTPEPDSDHDTTISGIVSHMYVTE